MLVVDQQPGDSSADQVPQPLPNSHSAALVMGFIFLCVLAYGIYRLIKRKCGHEKAPLTVSLGGQVDIEGGLEGLEDYIKEREAYLAIYGPKKATVSSISGTLGSRTDCVATYSSNR